MQNPNDQQGQPYNQQGQPNNGMLSSAEQMAEQKVNEAIDQFAHKIPGGENVSQQAKVAADNVLKNLEQQLEQQAEQHKGDVGSIIGNIFGGHNKP